MSQVCYNLGMRTIDLTVSDFLALVAAGVSIATFVRVTLAERTNRTTSMVSTPKIERKEKCTDYTSDILGFTKPENFYGLKKKSKSKIAKFGSKLEKECMALSRLIPLGTGNEKKDESNIEIHNTINELEHAFYSVVADKSKLGELVKYHYNFNDLMMAFDNANYKHRKELAETPWTWKKGRFDEIYRQCLEDVRNAPKTDLRIYQEEKFKAL